MTTVTLIGSDKGGVGKSEVSLIIALAHDKIRKPLKVTEIDHQAKLRTVLGDRVDLSLRTGATFGEMSKNRHAAMAYFSPIYEVWRQNDTLVDLGANVSSALFDWMRESDMITIIEQDGIGFRFVAVTTPDDQALKSATSSLEMAHSVLGPAASYFLVLNDTVGEHGFAPYKHTETWNRLEELGRSISYTKIEMPYCSSRLFEYGKAQRLSPLSVLDRAEEIANIIGLDRLESHLHRKRLVDWLFNVQGAFDPLFKSQPRASTRRQMTAAA